MPKEKQERDTIPENNPELIESGDSKLGGSIVALDHSNDNKKVPFKCYEHKGTIFIQIEGASQERADRAIRLLEDFVQTMEAATESIPSQAEVLSLGIYLSYVKKRLTELKDIQ